MSKVEDQLKNEFEEEEEALDAETQQKLNNMKIDETMFSSQTIKSKDPSSKSKKIKKNNRGVDFLDYAKNNGIDLKIQYEDVTAERSDYKDYNKKNNTEFINKSENNNRNNFNKKENFTNFGDNRQRNGGYYNHYNSQQNSNHYNYNSGRNNNFQYNQYNQKMNNKNYSNQSYYHNKKNNSNYQQNNGQNYNNYHHKRNQGNDHDDNYYNYRNTNNFNNKGKFARPINGNKYDSMSAQNYNFNPLMGNQGINMPGNMNGMNMYESQVPIQNPQAYMLYQQQMSDYLNAQAYMYHEMQTQSNPNVNANRSDQYINANYNINVNQQQNVQQDFVKQEETLFEMFEQYFSEDNLNNDYLIRSSLDDEGYLNSMHILNWNNMIQKGVTLEQLRDTFKDEASKIVESKVNSDGSLGLRNRNWESIKEKLKPMDIIYQQYMMMNRMYMMQQNYYMMNSMNYAQQNPMNINEANNSNSNLNDEIENQKAQL
jgi:hypothetical protein